MAQFYCCRPKKVLICIAMCETNQAVKREKQLMPCTIGDLVTKQNGSIVFTTLDLSSATINLNLQRKVDTSPCTFSTHFGLRPYKRFLFGINAASEIFQNTIEDLELLTGLRGCYHGFSKSCHSKVGYHVTIFSRQSIPKVLKSITSHP